jgi:hypothetical protein
MILYDLQMKVIRGEFESDPLWATAVNDWVSVSLAYWEFLKDKEEDGLFYINKNGIHPVYGYFISADKAKKFFDEQELKNCTSEGSELKFKILEKEVLNKDLGTVGEWDCSPHKSSQPICDQAQLSLIGQMVVETALERFQICGAEKDFCIQHVGTNVVFGGTNRVTWNRRHGFRIDESYCTARFVQEWHANFG